MTENRYGGTPPDQLNTAEAHCVSSAGVVMSMPTLAEDILCGIYEGYEVIYRPQTTVLDERP